MYIGFKKCLSKISKVDTHQCGLAMRVTTQERARTRVDNTEASQVLANQTTITTSTSHEVRFVDSKTIDRCAVWITQETGFSHYALKHDSLLKRDLIKKNADSYSPKYLRVSPMSSGERSRSMSGGRTGVWIQSLLSYPEKLVIVSARSRYLGMRSSTKLIKSTSSTFSPRWMSATH